jgi:general secretion pathway protein H
MRRPSDPSNAAPCSSGFTLIEIIVVLFLIVTMAGIGVTALTGSLLTGKIDGAARELASTLKHARMLAGTTGEAQIVTIDLESRSYWIEGRPARYFPGGITIVFSDILHGDTQSGRHYFIFDPIGSIEGGAVVFSTQKKYVRVQTDPVSGAVIHREKPKS